MSLDIYIREARNVVCPHCGEIVTREDVAGEASSGKDWYPILESLGYYVPYEKRTKDNDWYGKDMPLTAEQAEKLYWYIMENRDLYQGYLISGLIARALMNKNTVVINADW